MTGYIHDMWLWWNSLTPAQRAEQDRRLEPVRQAFERAKRRIVDEAIREDMQREQHGL